MPKQFGKVYNEMKRLSRLTNILLQLQSRRVVTAKGLANKFNITPRTVYHGIRAIEEAGIPIIREAVIGWASTNEEPNLFGLLESLSLLIFEEKGNNTILTWDVHFNSESKEAVKMNVAGFEQSLNRDIAQTLVDRYGSKVLENFVETQ